MRGQGQVPRLRNVFFDRRIAGPRVLSVFLSYLMESVSHLHRYIYFYQAENVLAFAASTSGSALVIDRATTRLNLQGTVV
jgi:hypothetical protein